MDIKWRACMCGSELLVVFDAVEVRWSLSGIPVCVGE